MPRAVLRPVWETSIDLRNQNSSSSGMRLLAWSALHRGDWVYVDRELLRVSELPKGPDEDVSFTSFRGRRVAFEDTSSEAHALGRPVYKVERPPARRDVLAERAAALHAHVSQRRWRADVGEGLAAHLHGARRRATTS